jgi:hypothetical protein
MDDLGPGPQAQRFWNEMTDKDNDPVRPVTTNLSTSVDPVRPATANLSTSVEDINEGFRGGFATEVSDIPEQSVDDDTSHSQLRPARDLIAETPIGNGRLNFDSRGQGAASNMSQSAVQEVDAVESFNMNDASFDSTPPTRGAVFGGPTGATQSNSVGIGGTASGTMSGWGPPVQSAAPPKMQAPNSSATDTNAVDTFVQDVEDDSDNSSPQLRRMSGPPPGAFQNSQPGPGRLSQASAPRRDDFDLGNVSVESM